MTPQPDGWGKTLVAAVLVVLLLEGLSFVLPLFPTPLPEPLGVTDKPIPWRLPRIGGLLLGALGGQVAEGLGLGPSFPCLPSCPPWTGPCPKPVKSELLQIQKRHQHAERRGRPMVPWAAAAPDRG